MREVLTLVLCVWSFGSFSMEGVTEAKECSYAKTGKNMLPCMQHGSAFYYVCDTCLSNDLSSICPACAKTCHNNHVVRQVDGTTVNYYCDCGGNQLGKKNVCKLMPINQDVDETSVHLDAYIRLLKNIVNPNESFTLSPVAIDGLMTSLRGLQGLRGKTDDNTMFPVHTLNLKVNGYCFGYDPIRAAIEGICTKRSLGELKNQILVETGFNFNFSGAKRVLAIIAQSVEKFVTPFAPESMSYTYPVYDVNNNKKTCKMMRDRYRRGYRFIDDKVISAAELPYKSGGRLVLLMSNDHNKNILNFSSEELVEMVNKLLRTEVSSSEKPLFIPKIIAKSQPRAVIDMLRTIFPDQAEILNDVDDLQIAAELSIEEEGTNARGAAVAISKSIGPRAIIFDHPFLALVLGSDNRVLFMSYNNF